MVTCFVKRIKLVVFCVYTICNLFVVNCQLDRLTGLKDLTCHSSSFCAYFSVGRSAGVLTMQVYNALCKGCEVIHLLGYIIACFLYFLVV